MIDGQLSSNLLPYSQRYLPPAVPAQPSPAKWAFTKRKGNMFTNVKDWRGPASMTRKGALPGTWRLDPAASRVEVLAKTYWGLVTVRGRFAALNGTATVTPDGRVTAELTIEAASVDTANDKRDRHLRSADFFHVERHPYLQVAIDEVVLTSPGTFTAEGRMTVAGRAQRVSFDGTIALSADGSRAEVNTAMEIDRVVFGLRHSPLGMIRRTVKGRAHLVFRAEDGGAAGAR
jgi:polyisoprenoid-binding protein YceI